MPKTDPTISQDALDALDMARDLICEAKGAEGPNGGFVTNHLDAAGGWLDKVEAHLRTPAISRLSATDTEAMRIVQKHYAHIASLDREAMTDAEREQTRGAWNAISAVKHEIDALAKGGA